MPNHSPYANVIDSFKAVEKERTLPSTQHYLPDALGTTYVALTMVILAFSNQLHVIPVLLFYAMWLPLPFVKSLGMLRPSLSMLWAASFSMLSTLSTFWSDYPSRTLYLGVAALSTITCVIILSRTVRFTAFVRGMAIGMAMIMAITLQSNLYGTDALGSAYALIGYFGSKNAVGGLASFGMIACASLFILEKSWWRRLLLCALPFALCVLCLYLSKSATSLIAVTLALLTMLWAGLLNGLSRRMKFLAVSATLLLVAASAVGIAMDRGSLVLNALGKDATLTGRTYLWNEGYKVGMERPLLGHGYSAFWVKGQPQAERYWYEFDIPYRDGFHFHSTYIQAFVDLGILGAVLVTLQLSGAWIASASFALNGNRRAEGALLLGFATLFVIRSFAEIDITSVFSISALLFYSIPLRLAQFTHTDRERAHG